MQAVFVSSPSNKKRIAIVGGGPAGLFAAETAVKGGASVTLYDAKASVGRKLLVAGRGGLNLTHGGDVDHFLSQYHGKNLPVELWRKMLENFDSDALRAWAAELGIETFEQRTGRVYPKEMKAAPLLRRWVERLKNCGVVFHANHKLLDFASSENRVDLTFSHDGNEVIYQHDAAIFAFGGGSWSITGSDGVWCEMMKRKEISVTPLAAANCGWEASWSQEFLQHAEGKPLKNISVRLGDHVMHGELMITRYGLEGGIVYALGRLLREMETPMFFVDLKPTFSADDLCKKMDAVTHDFLAHAAKRWKLSEAAHALLVHAADWNMDLRSLANLVKAIPILLEKPRPIDEAISSAGGVAWQEVNDSLILKKHPNIFLCGEMLDWEAPTGGYLMQGCFATAQHAARGAVTAFT